MRSVWKHAANESVERRRFERNRARRIPRNKRRL